MSPRAAWQLEALGFTEVYDYADGKLDWIAHGLPLEGKGPHYAVAGEVADRDAVLSCRVGDLVGDVSEELDSAPHEYCVVLNDRDVVLGRMRKKNVQGRPPDEPVELVMEPGPTTLRPKEPAKALLERMKKKNVPAVIVTTKTGRLIGAVTQLSLAELVSSP
jgi:CBS domain-containing protein